MTILFYTSCFAQAPRTKAVGGSGGLPQRRRRARSARACHRFWASWLPRHRREMRWKDRKRRGPRHASHRNFIPGRLINEGGFAWCRIRPHGLHGGRTTPSSLPALTARTQLATGGAPDSVRRCRRHARGAAPKKAATCRLTLAGFSSCAGRVPRASTMPRREGSRPGIAARRLLS